MLTYGCWFYSDEKPAPRRRLKSRFTVHLNGATLTFTGDFSMLLPIDKQLLGCTISYVDAAGNAALVDGDPVWATDRPDLLSLVPAEGGMGCDIIPVGPLGSAQITVTADADLGEGMKEILTLGTIECVAGEAVGGVINFPEPTPGVAP
jgi:hypothetical protein